MAHNVHGADSPDLHFELCFKADWKKKKYKIKKEE